MASGDGIDAIELADISININDISNNNSNINNNDNDNNDTQTATLNGTTNSNSSSNNTVVAQHNNINNNILTLSLKPDSSVNTIVAAATSQEDVTHLHSPNEMVPALPVAAVASSSRQLFHAAAAAHGGDDSNAFMQQEQQLQQQQQQQLLAQQRLRSASSTLDASISRNPSSAARHEKKIGHRRVDEGGEVTYKKIQSKQIMGSIQLGIQHTVGSLASKPKRDLLMNDFWEMETIAFPPEGSSITPAHHFSDFRFKVYAPIAFRYFRDLFGIAPDDFLISMVASPLLQLSNPGASGSIFYLTDDDEFIIKTVQKKECEFLQKLLPGYYMNLSQNPRTLLPKFFGLYCFHYNSKNVRLVAMNNLLPSDIKMHEKYDLKGSTFRRKASKAERQKPSPTFKDLDFMDRHPNGIFLETDKYNALMKTIQRDCTVLESFQIMDYSLLVGIHNLDQAAKERRNERIMNARAKLERNEQTSQNDENAVQSSDAPISGFYNNASSSAAASVASNLALAAGATAVASTAAAAATALNRSRSMNRPRLVAHSTAIESITADMGALLEEDEDMPAGGIPARSENDERLILYIGIIDILQSYRLEKKLEHTFKSIIYNGDTVSVCRPSFYAQRFLSFMGKTVFKKTPTFPLKHSPSKRKTSAVTMQSRTPQSRTPHQQLQPSLSAAALRPTLMSGSSTPPPAFDDISEEDITSNSATATMSRYGVRGGAHSPRHLLPQRSYLSSQRSSGDDDYSDNDYDNLSMLSGGGMRSPQRLSKTNVQQQATHGTVVLESNGQPLLATATTTTTTTIKAQTYTSTLVLDGVSR